MLERRNPGNYPHSFNVTPLCKIAGHATTSNTKGFKIVSSKMNENWTSYQNPEAMLKHKEVYYLYTMYFRIFFLPLQQNADSL